MWCGKGSSSIVIMKEMGQKDEICPYFWDYALLVQRFFVKKLYPFLVELNDLQPHYNLLKDLMIHLQYVI